MIKCLDEFEFRSDCPVNVRLIVYYCKHPSAFIFHWIDLILAGKEDNYKGLDDV